MTVSYLQLCARLVCRHRVRVFGVHILCGVEMFGLTVPKAPAKATPAAADDDIFADANVKTTNPVKAAQVYDEV